MRKEVSLNNLLIIVNIFIFFLSWFLYLVEGGNEYINGWSLILSTLLISETIFFLKYSEKNGNALLFILSFLLTFFYSFRILSLIYNPYSLVFMRFKCTWIDINYTLLFIIISSFALFAGIYFNKKKQFNSDENSVHVANNYFKPKNTIFILAFALLLMSSNLEGNIFSVFAGYLTSFFFNALYLLLACFTFFFFYKDKQNKVTIKIFYALLFIFILGQILSGSRSAFLSIGTIMIFVILSLHGVIYLKYKQIIILIVLVPISIGLFLITTFIRQNSARFIPFKEKIELIKSFSMVDGTNIKDVLKLSLAPVFDRIGFLDYATELIAQKSTYSSVINIPYYTKSIVDNVLTPGFNLFDTPKASNALIFIYDNKGDPSLKSLLSGNYQSDQMTIFGEFYCLWGGWFSVTVFLFLGYFTQKLILLTNKNEFKYYLKNAFVLYGFYTLVNSFGLDWFLFIILSLYITYHIFIFMLRLR